LYLFIFIYISKSFSDFNINF